MANLSDAVGKLTMSKDFYQEYKEQFKMVFDDVGEYGIYSDFEPLIELNEVEITFSGCGRWTLENTLNWYAEQFKKQTGVDFEGYWEYDEYECGCCILAHVYGDLRYGLDYDDYDYTDANKIKMEFEEGVCPINSQELKQYITNAYEIDLWESSYIKNKFSNEEAFYELFYSYIKRNDELDGGIINWRMEEILDDIEIFTNILINNVSLSDDMD